MIWMKRTALAIATGAALSLTALAAQAAPVGQSTAIADAVTGAHAGLVEAQYGNRHYRGRGYGRHHGGYGGHYRRHGRHYGRHYGRRRHNGGWWLPFVAAPFLYEGHRRHGYYYDRRYRDW